jgi:hypothetical protein
MDSKKRNSTVINRHSLISNLESTIEDNPEIKLNEEEMLQVQSKRKTLTQAIKTFCRIRPIEAKNGKLLLT